MNITQMIMIFVNNSKKNPLNQHCIFIMLSINYSASPY